MELLDDAPSPSVRSVDVRFKAVEEDPEAAEVEACDCRECGTLLGFVVEGGLTVAAGLAKREDVLGIGRVGAEKSILNEARDGG